MARTPVAVGDEAFDEVRSDEAVTPGDGDDVRHGFSDSRARGRIPRRLDGGSMPSDHGYPSRR